MDKVKIALSLISIAIIVGPIATELLIYKDNLPGLVIPSQFQSLTKKGNGGDPTGSSALSQFQMPQPVGQPQYDSTTGAFSYPFNFTNPLSTPISIDQLSADVTSPQGNETLGTVSLSDPITVNPGQNALVNVTGLLSQQELSQIETQYQQNGSLPISLSNVTADFGGVSIHLDQLSNIGSIPFSGGS